MKNVLAFLVVCLLTASMATAKKRDIRVCPIERMCPTSEFMYWIYEVGEDSKTKNLPAFFSPVRLEKEQLEHLISSQDTLKISLTRVSTGERIMWKNYLPYTMNTSNGLMVWWKENAFEKKESIIPEYSLHVPMIVILCIALGAMVMLIKSFVKTFARSEHKTAPA